MWTTHRLWGRRAHQQRRHRLHPPGARVVLVFALALALLAPSIATPAPTAQAAAMFTVNSTIDEDDANPGDGTCASTPSGVCTLRAAIMEANALPGADTITLPGGRYLLTRDGGDDSDTGLRGDLDILDSVTINGAGAASTLIDHNTCFHCDRALDIGAPSISVAISGLSIIGIATTNGSAGGGIRNRGSLTLTDVNVGGTGAGSGSLGGGIYNAGSLILTDVNVGGVVSGSGGLGGGVYNAGSLTGLRVLMQASSGGTGGSLFNAGSATLADVVIDGNHARSGGGVANDTTGHLTLQRTLIVNNRTEALTTAYPSPVGGGILNRGTLTAVNTTISRNTTSHVALGAPTGPGGGIYNDGGDVTLTNVTLGENTSDAVGHSLANASGTIRLKNTLLFRIGGGNCSGPITSLGANLDSGDSCGLSAPGDRSNVVPYVSPLSSNGGFSQTYALKGGSPALDAGDSGACPPDDQRGQPRPRDGNGDGATGCDIGAYEAQTALTPPAGGALTVNSAIDEPDGNLSDGLCASTPSGACTLRAAIMEANARPGADTITVPAGQYGLSLGDEDDTGAAGDLDILDSVTINGAGASSTIVTQTRATRVLDVVASSANVTITGLTVTGGRLGNSGPGAGIQNRGAVVLHNVLLQRNEGADRGGGLYNLGSAALTDVTVDGNGSYWSGGGIFNAGSLTATRLRIVRNGVYPTPGIVHPATEGGGLYNSGQATLIDAVVDGNGAEYGGGIFNTGTLTLTRALVSHNRASGVSRESVPFGQGGGIVSNGTLTATNVTVSSNQANKSMAGVLVGSAGSATLSNVTIAENNATGAGQSLTNAGGALRLRNSLVYRATDDNCSGTITSLGNNIDSGDSCGFNAQADQNNVEPRLGSLTDNGGFSQTHALQAGSPAIDTAADPACPPEDQRGAPRPRDGNGDGNSGCDIGAYELQTGNGGPVVTPTPTPTVPPISCTPRPPIRVEAVTPQTAPGTLTFRVTLTPPSGGGVNQFQRISFDSGSNATIEVPGQPARPPGFVFTPATGASTTFTVRRINPGAFTVRLTVVDACGAWPTFVGGGPNVP